MYDPWFNLAIGVA